MAIATTAANTERTSTKPQQMVMGEGCGDCGAYSCFTDFAHPSAATTELSHVTGKWPSFGFQPFLVAIFEGGHGRLQVFRQGVHMQDGVDVYRWMRDCGAHNLILAASTSMARPSHPSWV
jgi:hypothetical protein